MLRFFISFKRPATALGPSFLPGSGAGLKNISLNLSRLPSLRNKVSSPYTNSNTGPPRIAAGSFGLPPNPRAIVPPSILARRSRSSSPALIPSQGIITFSFIPGSFWMKRPPLAIIKRS